MITQKAAAVNSGAGKKELFEKYADFPSPTL
jgi:hypothetical protein